MPGGAEYFVSIIDDTCRFASVYLLEWKSDALEAFKIFLGIIHDHLLSHTKVVG
jgi:hypothetical protein